MPVGGGSTAGPVASRVATPAPTCDWTVRVRTSNLRPGSAMIVMDWHGRPTEDDLAWIRGVPGVVSVTVVTSEPFGTIERCDGNTDLASVLVDVGDGDIEAVRNGLLALFPDRSEPDTIGQFLNRPCDTGAAIDDFSAIVRVTWNITQSQRTAIDAALRATSQVESAEFNDGPAVAGGPLGCPSSAPATVDLTLGRYFWVRMKTSFGYDDIRAAVAGLPGVVDVLPPGTRVR
ncbi:hypothetical protein ACFQX7_24010 [Luedemannella flava]